MIIVSSLADAPLLIASHSIRHVVSILGPEMATPSFPSSSPLQHLRLCFHDVSKLSTNHLSPNADHMEQFFHFIRQWNPQHPLLIHCWFGISRSPACAYVALCHLNPEVGELLLAQYLRQVAPFATPNPLIISLADQYLARAGAMCSAIADMGRGCEAAAGLPFILPANGPF